MDRKMKEMLKETEDRMKPYMSDMNSTRQLRAMCKNCEAYCGKHHDYSECKDKWCFKFWLAYEHLHWISGYE